MPDFNDFLTLLKEHLVTLGRSEVEEHAEALLQDGQDFAQQAEADLKQWTGALAAGAMTGPEFRLAVRGRAELAQMEALKQAGLAAIRIDKLKQSIVDTIVDAATHTFLT